MSDFESYTLTEEDVEVESFFGDDWGRSAGTYRAHGYRCSCGYASSGWGDARTAATLADSHLEREHNLHRAESLSGLDRDKVVELENGAAGILRGLEHGILFGTVLLALRVPGCGLRAYEVAPSTLCRVTAPQEVTDDDPPGD